MPVLASPLGLLPALGSLPFACWLPFHAVGAFHGLGPVALQVCVACVCARAPAAYASPPAPRVGVARALRAVLVHGAGRAVPGVLCLSAVPAPVACSAYLALGEVARSLRPLAWLGVARPPAARPAFVSSLCAPFGRREGARGGAHLARVWGIHGWALCLPRPPVLGACGRGALPAGCRCKRRGRGDPSPAPQRVLLRAGFQRCGGRHEGGRGEGASLAWLWGVRGWALSLARRPVLGACARGPLPTSCGCRRCGRGDPQPIPQRALLRAGFAHCGAAGGRLGGGRLLPGCAASRGGRSPSLDRPSLGRAAGVRYRQAVVAGPVCLGTRHQPHSAPSGVLALLAVGAARGRPGGVSLASVCGIWRWAPSHARLPVLEACRRGPLATGCGPGGCARGDLSPTPQRALLRAGFEGCGGGTRAPGVGVFFLGVGRPGLGALPRPTACPWGVRPGPASHWLWLRGGCGCWDRSSSPQRALLRPCFARLGGGTRAPRWGRLLPWCGASGLGRSPWPDRPSLWRAAGARYPTSVGAGVVGVGTRHQPHSAPSCELALRAMGAAQGYPVGGVSCLGVGRPGLGALPRLTVSLEACGRGPLSTGCGCGDVGVATRQRPHSARSCVLALRAVRGA